MYAEPVRYQFDRVRAAALLRLAALTPSGHVLNPLPEVAEPAAVLRDTDLVDETGSAPVPLLAEALQIVATPARVLSVTVNVPGVTEWLTTQVAAGPTGGPYVIVSTGGELFDLFVLSSEMEVVAVLDDLLDLTTYPSQPVSPDLVIDFAGWIGLMAAADVRRAARLRAELERLPAPEVTLDAEALEAQLTAGLRNSDTRWAVTASVPISPANLRRLRPSGSEALEAMARAGLIDRPSGGARFTEVGSSVADLVTQAVKVAGVTLRFIAPDREVRGGEVTVLRTPLRLGLGFWNGTGGQFNVTLIEPMPEAAVEMLRRLLLLESPLPAEAPTEEGKCPGCGAEMEPGRKFCTACGAPMAEPVIEETPVSAPAPTSAPSVCPACGAQVKPGRKFCTQCGAPLAGPPGGRGG